MKVKYLLILTVIALLAGCGSSVNVTVGQLSPFTQLRTAALVPQDGNTPEVDAVVQQQLMAHSIAPLPPLPPGTRQSGDVDLIVTYSEKGSTERPPRPSLITVNLFEAPTGNLLATGHWTNSRLQMSPDRNEVVKGLIDQVMAELAVR
jgi:hypothetical protein